MPIEFLLANDYMKRLVLVTGATGQLGKVLVARLTEIPSTEIRTIGRVEDEFDLDWFNPRDQTQLFESVSMVHLAWNTSDRRELAQRRSLHQTDELVNWCEENRVRLIFISSMSSHAQAISNYGLHKFLAESVVLARGGSVIKAGLVLTTSPEGLLGVFNRSLFSFLRIHLVSPTPMIPIVHEKEFLNAICKEAIHPTENGRIELVSEWLSTVEVFARLHTTDSRGIVIPVRTNFLMSILRVTSRFSSTAANLYDSLLGLVATRTDVVQSRTQP